jgi:hypothetical protein
MISNMFSKSFKSLFFLLLFVGFSSSFAQAPALNFAGCQTFSNTLGTNYMVTWGSANAAQRAQWQASGCYTSPQAAAPVAPVAPAPVVAAAVPFMGCQVMSNTLGINHNVTWGNANIDQQAQWTQQGCRTSPNVAAPVAPAPVVAAAVPFMGCQAMSNSLGTVYDYTWGNANVVQQAQWTQLGCRTRPQAPAPGTLYPLASSPKEFCRTNTHVSNKISCEDNVTASEKCTAAVSARFSAPTQPQSGERALQISRTQAGLNDCAVSFAARK